MDGNYYVLLLLVRATTSDGRYTRRQTAAATTVAAYQHTEQHQHQHSEYIHKSSYSAEKNKPVARYHRYYSYRHVANSNNILLFSFDCARSMVFLVPIAISRTTWFYHMKLRAMPIFMRDFFEVAYIVYVIFRIASFLLLFFRVVG